MRRHPLAIRWILVLAATALPGMNNAQESPDPPTLEFAFEVRAQVADPTADTLYMSLTSAFGTRHRRSCDA